MITDEILNQIEPADLISEASPLVMWDMGLTADIEEVAQYMYRGGPYPPQGSVRPEQIPPDERPDKKFWTAVKEQMRILLCTDDDRYDELRKQLNSIKPFATNSVVAVIATGLATTIGVQAGLISGFVAVCLFAAIKVGKEAYCASSTDHDA